MAYYYIYDTENREFINIIFHTRREARAYLARLLGCNSAAELGEYIKQYKTPLRIEKHDKLYF